MNKKARQNRRRRKYALRRALFSLYAHLKYPSLLWRLFNIAPTIAFYKERQQLGGLQEKILNDLRETGIAITSLDELFPDHNHLADLQRYTATKADRCRQNSKKRYLQDYLALIPDLGPEIPFFILATHPTIVGIVNSYMAMQTHLTQFFLQKTKVSQREALEHGQQWHRAPQEGRLCKVYIYLSDVDEDSGPFMYVPHSTKGKKWGALYPNTPGSKPYLSNKEIKKTIPADERRTITGTAGTVIIADTTGLHRGGFATKHPRIMSTFTYAAPTYRENINYSFTQKTLEAMADLPASSRALLRKKWMRRVH